MAIFSENILMALKVQSEKLEPYIHHVLTQNRKLLLQEIEELMSQVDSKYRLKLLEILVADGGVDLIPLFTNWITKEPNLLFAKSILMLFGQFEHYEALVALRELSRGMRKELTSAHMRVMGKLNSKFREHFYMKEFKENSDNSKRIKHAAEAMMREPHPLYVPFLEEHILLGEGYRIPGCRALCLLGEQSSIEPLFELVAQISSETGKMRPLLEFLIDDSVLGLTSLNDFMNALGRLADWENDLIQGMVQDVKEKRLSNTLDWVKFSFGPFSMEHWRETNMYLRDFLKGSKPSNSQKMRLKMVFDGYLKKRGQMLEAVAGAIGEVGRRKSVTGLFNRMDQTIPMEEPARDLVMVGFMAAYRDDSSAEALCRRLDSVEDTKLLIRILEALAQMSSRTIPPALVEHASNSEDKDIRSKAMHILGCWRADENTLETLMRRPESVIRVEIIELIAQHKLEEGYKHLLEYLAYEQDQELQIITIRALSSFPRAKTGDSLFPYLDMETSAPIRQAAMQTILRAGGPESMGMIFDQLEKCKSKQLVEALGMMFRFLDPLKGEEHPPDLLAYPGKWGTLLMDRSDRFRYQVLNILGRAQWERDIDHAAWMDILQKAVKSIKVKRAEAEVQRMRGLYVKAKTAMEEREQQKDGDQQDQKKKSEVVKLLDVIENAAHHEKVGALRKLNLMIRPGVLEEQETVRLAYQIQNFFQESAGDTADLKLAISIAVKLGDDNLNREMMKYEESDDHELARFARSALALGRKQGTVSRTISRILLVDHSVMARVLSGFLQKNGFEVTVEHEPAQALVILEKHSFDLLLAEYQLGEATGVDLIKEARHRHILAPSVILMSSSRDEAIQSDMNTANADAVLLKPFPTGQLYEKIKALEMPAG